MNAPMICLLIVGFCTHLLASEAPEGWSTASPRDEIKPRFAYELEGGPTRKGSFVIESDAREGLMGKWTKTFLVKGGEHYAFGVLRKMTGADSPRRAGVARVLWRDAKGKSVRHDEPSFASYLPGEKPVAEPEYPLEGATDAQGSWDVSCPDPSCQSIR